VVEEKSLPTGGHQSGHKGKALVRLGSDYAVRAGGPSARQPVLRYRSFLRKVYPRVRMTLPRERILDQLVPEQTGADALPDAESSRPGSSTTRSPNSTRSISNVCGRALFSRMRRRPIAAFDPANASWSSSLGRLIRFNGRHAVQKTTAGPENVHRLGLIQCGNRQEPARPRPNCARAAPQVGRTISQVSIPATQISGFRPPS